MNNIKKKDWLAVKYPLTVICDRYDGTYSGARWLAFPLDYNDIPSGVDDGDVECSQFWEEYKGPVGKGAYASDAVVDLIQQMRESEPEESEDEKIRQSLLAYIKGESKRLDTKKWIAYLEKQKELDKMIVVSPEVWSNAISDAFENGKKEGEKQKEPHYTKRNALFDKCVENCDPKVMKEVSDKVDEMLQKEQKPVEYLDKDKVYAIMTKLTNLSFSQLIPILSDEYKKIDEITSDVRSLLDYPIEQKPTWSEEDEDMLNSCISSIEEAKENRYAYKETDGDTSYDREINWLKSLRPSWKPSEEQIVCLERVIAFKNPEPEDIKGCEELLDQLKKL